MKEPFEPPAELFEQLQKDLKAEMRAMPPEHRLSERTKLHRLMEQLRPFAGAWLEHLAPARHKTTRKEASVAFRALITSIVAAITAREALRAVKLPRGGIGAITHEAGQINSAEPEYPDRPFPETPETLAHWEKEIARLQRVEAPRAKAAEEIQLRPYGLFERALAPEWPQEAISFRPNIGWMEEQLRRHLMWEAEKLLLEYALKIPEAESLPEPAPVRGAPPDLEMPAKGPVASPKPALLVDPKVAQETAVDTMIEAARQSADPMSSFEELLKRAKWERKPLAEAAGLSQPTISRIFRGEGSKKSRKKFSQALAKRLAVLADSH